MLGIRELEVYGCETYLDLVNYVMQSANSLNILAECYQSNHEGEIVDKIQRCFFEKYSGIVINPAAYTHTSIAIYDALKATRIPSVEVHISDITNREEFRKKSYISDACIKTIFGKGFKGYKIALEFLSKKIRSKS